MQLFSIYLTIINTFNFYFVYKKKFKSVIIIENLLKVLKLLAIAKI